MNLTRQPGGVILGEVQRCTPDLLEIGSANLQTGSGSNHGQRRDHQGGQHGGRG